MVFTKIDNYVQKHIEVEFFVRNYLSRPVLRRDIEAMIDMVEQIDNINPTDIENEMWENTSGDILLTDKYKNIIHNKLSKLEPIFSCVSKVIGKEMMPHKDVMVLFNDDTDNQRTIYNYLYGKGMTDWDENMKYTNNLLGLMDTTLYCELVLNSIFLGINIDNLDYSVFEGKKNFRFANKLPIRKLHTFMVNEGVIPEEVTENYFTQCFLKGAFAGMYKMRSVKKVKLHRTIDMFGQKYESGFYVNGDIGDYRSVAAISIGKTKNAITKGEITDGYLDRLAEIL